jgi:hypothetical protein
VLDAMAHPGPARASAVPTSACLQALAPGDAISVNAERGDRLFQYRGTTAEPPLKPYANAA